MGAISRYPLYLHQKKAEDAALIGARAWEYESSVVLIYSTYMNFHDLPSEADSVG